MKLYDLLGLLICWAGVGGISFIVMKFNPDHLDNFVLTLICLASGYYLSKWIITTKRGG